MNFPLAICKRCTYAVSGGSDLFFFFPFFPFLLTKQVVVVPQWVEWGLSVPGTIGSEERKKEKTLLPRRKEKGNRAVVNLFSVSVSGSTHCMCCIPTRSQRKEEEEEKGFIHLESLSLSPFPFRLCNYFLVPVQFEKVAFFRFVVAHYRRKARVIKTPVSIWKRGEKEKKTGKPSSLNWARTQVQKRCSIFLIFFFFRRLLNCNKRGGGCGVKGKPLHASNPPFYITFFW